MNCFEIGLSLPTYKETEPSAEMLYVDMEGLTAYSQTAQTLSAEQPQNAPWRQCGFAPVSIPSVNSAAIFSNPAPSNIIPLSFSLSLIISLN